MLRPLVALALLTCPAFAGEVTYTVQSATAPFPATFAVQPPQFNPTIGQLESVSVIAAVTMSGSIAFENLDVGPSPATTGNPHVVGWVNGPLFGGVGFNNPIVGWDTTLSVPPLAPFDGTIDHAGPSGYQLPIGPTCGGSWRMAPSTVGLAAFVGVGTIAVTVNAWGKSDFYATYFPIDFDDQIKGQLSFTITYHYADFPARFCLNQGCPCGAPGMHTGCPTNANVFGADLDSSGVSHIVGDDFVLTASGLPNSTSALFFQGTASVPGVVMGDGVRCVGGSLLRLGVKHASLGVASFPDVGDAPISIKGAVVAGELRTYQAWYRDPSMWCTLDNSNITSAVATVWTP